MGRYRRTEDWERGGDRDKGKTLLAVSFSIPHHLFVLPHFLLFLYLCVAGEDASAKIFLPPRCRNRIHFCAKKISSDFFVRVIPVMSLSPRRRGYGIKRRKLSRMKGGGSGRGREAEIAMITREEGTERQVGPERQTFPSLPAIFPEKNPTQKTLSPPSSNLEMDCVSPHFPSVCPAHSSRFAAAAAASAAFTSLSQIFPPFCDGASTSFYAFSLSPPFFRRRRRLVFFWRRPRL